MTQSLSRALPSSSPGSLDTVPVWGVPSYQRFVTRPPEADPAGASSYSHNPVDDKGDPEWPGATLPSLTSNNPRPRDRKAMRATSR